MLEEREKKVFLKDLSFEISFYVKMAASRRMWHIWNVSFAINFSVSRRKEEEENSILNLFWFSFTPPKMISNKISVHCERWLKPEFRVIWSTFSIIMIRYFSHEFVPGFQKLRKISESEVKYFKSQTSVSQGMKSRYLI